MPRNGTATEDGLAHVVVCGGTVDQWGAMSSTDWRVRFETVARGVREVGARWVTVFPHHGSEGESADVSGALGQLVDVSSLAAHGITRHVWAAGPDLSVVVDPNADGHARFAGVVESLRAQNVDFDEDVLSLALSDPVDVEADLVLILGPPDILPTSLVWELAYSELVFLDISWTELQAGHLEMAIDDFNRRHRRFGGLDS